MKVMLPPIKKYGFSLIELLIAMAIFSSLALVSVHLLWGTVSTRTKQSSIEEANDNLRLLVSNLTKEIQSAKSVSLDNCTLGICHTLKISGDICRTIRWNTYDPTDQYVEEAVDSANPCQPPITNFSRISKKQIFIDTVDFSSPTGAGQAKIISIKISGLFKDNFGNHPIEYETTVTPRVVY